MAPKKGDAKAAKAAEKTRAENKKKAAEDKTFGLKNKNKSKVVRTYVQEVHRQVDNTNRRQDGGDPAKKKKEAEAKKQAELDALLGMAIKQPKVPPGVDPKSIMCEFYKKGKCTKGFKCKFSHNDAVERKGAKMDIYSDKRDEDEEGMDEWDQETLEKAVKQKHGSEKPNQTKIICKHFIEAIEKKQYGWFWVCPNDGKNCQYRHALPPGYVLKSQMKQLMEEEMANKKSVEEEIEEERQKVEAHTPLTEEVFRDWRQKKQAERVEREQQLKEERMKGGRFTGREIFAQEGFEAVDDSSASGTLEREDRSAEDAEIRAQEVAAREAQDNARAAAGIPAGPVLDAPSQRQPREMPGKAKPASPSAPAAPLPTISKEDEELFLDEDDDMDDDELDAIAEGLHSAKM